ncbi:domain found in IF2B/IF5 [Ancylostoma duodenale]|uniref:Eukaryotic translation initiation factor 5 n=1 Tax=Ancylostoma duodenale TaxID=51022 RepID=A0A0C2DW46_9BILA|nr:domain found in IF2B/IF5 [Ancylostoma duodenale]
MALNVNRAVTDPFYRYKMPKLLAKVEGKGNGIKTVVANMSDIAKSLERPPMCVKASRSSHLDPTKYFGCELGAQTNYDAKNERYIVNGEHDAAKLQDILDGFIKKFVLCPACENPETALSVRRNQIHSKCKACGHAFIIDNRHKLSTYILKNPPKIEVDFSKDNKQNGNGHVKEEDLGVEANGDRNSSNDDDDDDWAPEEDEAPNTKLAAGIGKLVIDKDLDKSIEERLDMLHRFFVEAKEKGTIGDGKALADEAERLELKQKAPLLLADVLFDQDIIRDGIAQIKNNRRVLLRFTLNDRKAQRYLLGGIEQLIIKHEAILLPKAAHIIKALYDNDICEEEAILAWGDKPSSKYVTKTQSKKIVQKCEAVLTWLREAEEEDDDEEESNDEVEFDDRNQKTSVYAEKAKAQATAEDIKVQGDDGVEIDIDDI